MSADNGVYILKTKDQYRVAHIQGIDNIYFSFMDGDWRDIESKKNKYVPTRVVEFWGECNFTRSAKRAFEISNKIEKNLPICEYGVCVITYNKKWEDILNDAKRYAKKELKYIKKDEDNNVTTNPYYKMNLEKIVNGYYNAIDKQKEKNMNVGVFNNYNGYTGSIGFSLNEEYPYYGKLLNVPDLITYRAKTIEKLYDEYKYAVDDYIEMTEGIV